MKIMRSADFAFKLKPLMLLLCSVATLCDTPLSNAGTLPGGGRFVAGSGTISGNGTSLSINQTSFRGVIDWDSFSIGFGNRVTLDNGNGATLNRVTGGDLSTILGSLSATGSLYLINPHGIVVGPSGIVSTGQRFVASTIDADDTAFMNGGPLTLSGNSEKSVINFGKIGSTGGDVFLISSKGATNLGTISAPNGSAELAAGQRVLIQDTSSSKQVFVQLGSAGTVFNRGEIAAAQVNLQAADGNVYAFTGNHAAIRATGTATREGRIWLVADSGSVKLAGPIEAKNADGSGGTVDTIAGNLLFANCGPATVVAGTWNVSAPDVTIGDAAALAFSRSLNAGTSINVQATAGAGHAGNVNVASNVGWHGGASLMLSAYHAVDVAQGVTLANHGIGNLVLRADSTAIDNGGRVTNLGTIDWSHSTGTVRAFYDSQAVGGGYTPGKQLTNAAWTPLPNGGVLQQITAYQLVNTLADLQAIGNRPSGTYALGRDIDASATGDGSFVPIGDGTTPFSGLFDGFGHRITSLTLTQTVGFLGPQGQVTGVQGLFGVIGNGALVRNVSVAGTGNVADLDSYAYGMLAGVNFGTIENANTSGTINGIGSEGGLSAGGLVGVNNGTLRRTSSGVDIASSGDNVGGLVGINYGIIAQSYATGAVVGPLGSTADDDAGGLVGYNAVESSITQSYATGAVEASGYANSGGLAGFNGGRIMQSFATGSVDSIRSVGGIAGVNTGTIGNDVYWNAEASGTVVAVGTNVDSATAPPSTNGLTNGQMRLPSSFVGYDFGSHGVWGMPEGAAHPVLAWQLGFSN